jgi:hypothetical protein
MLFCGFVSRQSNRNDLQAAFDKKMDFKSVRDKDHKNNEKLK